MRESLARDAGKHLRTAEARLWSLSPALGQLSAAPCGGWLRVITWGRAAQDSRGARGGRSDRVVMNRRYAGVADRHALLSSAALPGGYSKYRVSTLTEQDSPQRTESPFENPYADASPGWPAASGATASGRSGLYAAQQATASELEEQNDSRLNGLSERIKLLKQVRQWGSHT